MRGTDRLFEPANVGRRVDYVSGSVVAHSPRDERSRWEARVSGDNRESLKTAVGIWYGGSHLGRDRFRRELIDEGTSDAIVDDLRAAARGIVTSRTHEELGTAGALLATAAQGVGLYQWPGFIGDAERKGLRAVERGEVPGVTKASVVGGSPQAMAMGAVLGLVILGFQALTGRGSGPAKPSIAPAQPPAAPPKPSSEDDAAPSPSPRPAVIPDGRRRHILDGEVQGDSYSGGHRYGTGSPGKTEFPQDWSDDKIIGSIRDVVNDPSSDRKPAGGDRIAVTGRRDGVDILVIVRPDGRTVVTAYPTNTPRNPQGERP